MLLCFLRIVNLLVLTHMLTECVLVVCQEVALATNALVMHLVDVGSEAFGARCFVVAQNAEVGFDVGVEMTLEAPVIHASPGAVRAGVQLLLFLLIAAATTTSS